MMTNHDKLKEMTCTICGKANLPDNIVWHRIEVIQKNVLSLRIIRKIFWEAAACQSCAKNRFEKDGEYILVDKKSGK